MVNLGATSILTKFGLPASSFAPRPPGLRKLVTPPIGPKIKLVVGTYAWAHLKGLVEQNNTLQSDNAQLQWFLLYCSIDLRDGFYHIPLYSRVR